MTIGNAAMLVRSDAWQALARNGHELGNRTIYHPCRSSLPDREWVEPYYDLDTYVRIMDHVQSQLEQSDSRPA